ncbi:MAG: GAF domain-containing protein [Prolixibacteraceae bacterium]|nr:GAF domain-containing protein [Prolixibacteraceae bacterium]
MNIEKIYNLVDETLLDDSANNEKLKAICSLLKEEVHHYDWVGFYILDKSQNILLLGPYVGKPTDHTKIPVGKGVCGQVAENCSTMIVQDVSNIDNYIACSIDVQSEIVVPVMKDNVFVAEIDIDSHAFAPFTNRDQELLETIASKIKELF